jgi:hypothetical protein
MPAFRRPVVSLIYLGRLLMFSVCYRAFAFDPSFLLFVGDFVILFVIIHFVSAWSQSNSFPCQSRVPTPCVAVQNVAPFNIQPYLAHTSMEATFGFGMS